MEIKTGHIRRGISFSRFPIIILGALLIFMVFSPINAQYEIQLNDIYEVRGLALHPKGQILAIGGRVNGKPGFWLYNMITGGIDVIETDGTVGFISWSPDGSRIAGDIGVGNAATFQIFDVATKQLSVSFEQSPSPSFILWDSDISRVATVTDSIINIWDANSAATILTLSLTPTDVIGPFSAIAWDNSIRQRMYGLVGYDKQLFVWNTDTGDLIEQYTIPFHSESIALSPDFSKLALGSLDGDGSILVLDAFTGATYITLQGDQGEFPQTLVWHPKNRLLATYGGASRGGVIKVWDTVTGQQIFDVPVARVVPFDSLVWSFDGSQLIYSEGLGNVKFVDFPSTNHLPCSSSNR